MLGVGNLTGGTSELYAIANYAVAPIATLVGDTGIGLFDVAVHPTSGTIYAVGFGNLYTLDRSTAQPTLVGSTGISGLNALTFDHCGRLFSWGYTQPTLYELDPVTAAPTAVDTLSAASAGDLAFDGEGVLWGSTVTDQLLRYDPRTGVSTLVGPGFGVTHIYGLGFDEGGLLYGSRGSDSSAAAELYTIDTTSGVATFVGAIAGADGAWGHYGLDLAMPALTTAGFCFGNGQDGPCPCQNEGVTCAGCRNSSMVGARLVARNSASILADDLVLVASDVPANQNGILFMGAGQLGPAPFGDGLLCIGAGGAALCRFPVRNSGASGTLGEGPGIVSFSQSQQAACHISVGQTWNFQGWFRDPGGSCGSAFNLSNAVAVTFSL